MKDLFVVTNLTPRMQQRLADGFTIRHVGEMDDPVAWLNANGAGIEHVLTDGHQGLKAAYFDALPDLKIISSYGVGYDAIDTDKAVARGVLVTHTPQVLNAEVATTALMLLIACYRQFLPNAEQARSGRWESEGGLPLARSADNRTIGILGLGRIGMTIAQKLEPFSPRLLYTARSQKDVAYTYFDDLTAMAAEADALICVAPGGAETHHLVNAEVMEALGPDGVLINVGRGSVVDEAAMIAALSDGRLGMAGLDVFEDEPRIPETLRGLPNVVLTPHIGSATVETRAAMGDLSVDNLLAYLRDGSVVTPVPECLELIG